MHIVFIDRGQMPPSNLDELHQSELIVQVDGMKSASIGPDLKTVSMLRSELVAQPKIPYFTKV